MSQQIELKLKLNYRQTFIIGIGFLASSLAWAVYNAQVPLILSERFFMSNTLIGTIMTIDNFFGVILLPLIGAWSDHTRSRIGRRMPWIAIGLPLCAIVFSLIPLQQVLWAFMAVIIAFNLMMALWRGPVVTLMPDVTPSPLRSEANGIINLMGGLGAIIALFLGGILSDLRDDKFFAFYMASIIMMMALFILLKYVREPDSLNYREENNLPIPNTTANRWGLEARQQFAHYHATHTETIEPSAATEDTQRSLTAFMALPQQYKMSLAALLIAIFAWFLGYNAIEAFFTLYATNTYSISGGQASIMLAVFSLSFLVFAIPAGLFAKSFGRKRTIVLGLVGLMVAFTPLLFQPSQMTVQILLTLAGIFWACVNINSLPMVLEFASEKNFGTFTGYYYLFSFTAAIVSPIFYGYIQDFFHTNELLFAFSLVCFSVALFCMMFVQHGDLQKEQPQNNIL